MKIKVIYYYGFWEKKQDHKIQRKKREKKCVLKNLYAHSEGGESVRNAFESKMFPVQIEGTSFSDKVLDHSSLTILTPKQMF